SLVAEHMRFMHVDEMRRSKLRRFMAMEHFEDHLELHRVDCEACHGKLDNYYFCLDKMREFAEEDARPGLPDPLLTGHDLIAMGYEPGPRMGEMLEALREAQLEGEINFRGEAVAFIQNQYPKTD
ncbi:MAG: CCA tRNA nucleotidyltransferase, partial [Candidatus Sumerlaeota bacterium]